MPFQIFQGRTGPRLIAVDPVVGERSIVTLEDGRTIVVSPSLTLVNGYPGIKAVNDELPDDVALSYREQKRASVRRIRALQSRSNHQAVPYSNVLYYDSTIVAIKRQPLMCANIVIGRPMLLVLPKRLFEQSRFRLARVTDLTVAT